MKNALLTTTVTSFERIVLLDMAVAVDDDAPLYSWGHDRLALALGKMPGTRSATRAVDRVLAGLRTRELVKLSGKPHRGRRAEYTLTVIEENAPRSERGAFESRSADNPTNAPRFNDEWTPVSERMDPGLTGVPLPITPPFTPPSRVQRFASHDEADVVDVEAIESGDTPSVGGRSGRTDAQVSLLSDWFILSGHGIPDDRVHEWFRSLTNDEFTSLKQAYTRERDKGGRGPGYDGPVQGEPEYEHLTARGKQWADVGCLPGEMEP
jgi:hypothetical protein